MIQKYFIGWLNSTNFMWYKMILFLWYKIFYSKIEVQNNIIFYGTKTYYSKIEQYNSIFSCVKNNFIICNVEIFLNDTMFM